MKKKGFTLIELLGVIVILALLMLVVFPSIINSIKKSNEKKDNLTRDLIYNAAEMYIEKYDDEFNKTNGNKYDISLRTLVDENFLKTPIEFSGNNGDLTDKKCVQVEYNDGFTYDIKNVGKCYNSTIMKPDLMNNTLKAVIYEEEKEFWKIVDPNLDWYNYAEQKWANAVILDENVRTNREFNDYIIVDKVEIIAKDGQSGKKFSVDGKSAILDGNVIVDESTNRVISISGILTLSNGVEIKVDNVNSIEYIEDQNYDLITLNPDTLGMFVWIPRYEYKIDGLYADGTIESPGAININFISETRVKASDNYIIHPAFTFGEEELSGFWVGKFEPTHIEFPTSPEYRIEEDEKGNKYSVDLSNRLNCNNENCENADGLRVIPSVSLQSLRTNNVSNIFFSVRSMGRYNNPFGINANMTDSHMMKNSEWGAVAYLTQSEYGKYGNSEYEGANKEVYINNSSAYYVGKSSGAPYKVNTASIVYLNKDDYVLNKAYSFSSTKYPDEASYENVYTSSFGFYTYQNYLLKFPYDSKATYEDGKRIIVDNLGYGASTTGNMYGIFDMSGGSHEIVMGVLADSNGKPMSGRYNDEIKAYHSGFNGILSGDSEHSSVEYTSGVDIPNSKYYDLYTSTSAKTACNGKPCYGHALSETYGWYNNGHYFFSDDTQWLHRGAGERAGIFSYTTSSGQASDGDSFRIVLSPTR